MESTKNIKTTLGDQEYKATIKRIGFITTNKIRDNSTVVELINGKPQAKVDAGELATQIVTHGLVNVTNGSNVSIPLDELTADVGMWLMKEIQDFSSVNQKKEESSNES